MTGTLCIIPARMASGRFPGKPLEPILGLPLVLHIYERCRLSAALDRVVVATCDEEIREACEAHGAETVMTANNHPGCVDRTEEAIIKIGGDLADDDLVLMVQGDEILFGPDMADAIVHAYRDSNSPVVNLASPILNALDHEDPNCVKVAVALSGRALFFSRSPIPSRARTSDVPMFQQTGVIGFSKEFLLRFGLLERTPLECSEHIDMLRTLEHGYPVQIVKAVRPTLGVDTPEDRDRAESLLKIDQWTQKYLVFEG